MKIILLAHPNFMKSKSMPLFAKMLSDYFDVREVLSPWPFFYNIPGSVNFKKWMGYIDQYIIFPFYLKWKSFRCDKDTVFVFADQALGPWVPWINKYPHVIHCHDLLALRSALGEISENNISFTGKVYQKYIRWGFSKGKNFISVSNKTKLDLHRLADIKSTNSFVVFNGLNYPYKPMEEKLRMGFLKEVGVPVDKRGFLLHVGGDQWYKNRVGVVEMYAEYAKSVVDPIPLWMVGPKEQKEVLSAVEKVPDNGEVYMLSGLNAVTLNAAYAHAQVMLFPSLDEGFGWPIVEAQASGTLVLTTDQAPMTEVGGGAAFYHYRRTSENSSQWAKDGGNYIKRILEMSDYEKNKIIDQGLNNAKRFSVEKTMEGYKEIYLMALGDSGKN